jgi:hypothetical protein
MMVVVVMMVVPMAPVVTVMVKMVVVMGLCELHSGVRRCSRLALIDHLQRRRCIGDRL